MAEVVVNNISKSFNDGELKAVRDVSFSVEKGELFGLIGPDGAGKSTIFRMLTTLMLPDSGNARVNGFDIISGYREIRQRVGYMPGRFSLYQDLTVEENLNFFATIFNTTVHENYEFIKEIYDQIAPFKKRRAGKLSGGMKQKLALCCALIHRPTVLFLDEPTTGVDVVSRKEFWDMLKKLKAQNISILVSTPYMDEATKCDRIALIQKGTIMSVDSPGGIIEKFPRPLFAAKASEQYRLLQYVRADKNVDSCYAFGEYIHFTLREANSSEQHAMAITQGQSFEGLEIRRITPTIEDSFIRLMRASDNNGDANGK